MHHSRRLQIVRVGTVAIATASLTACGSQGSSESIEQVWPEAHQQIEVATSVRIQGDMGSGSEAMEVEYAGQLHSSNFHALVYAADGTQLETLGNEEVSNGQFPEAFLESLDPESPVTEIVNGRWLAHSTESLNLSVELFFEDGTENLPGDTWDGEDAEPEQVERFGRDLYRYEDSARGGAIYVYPTDLTHAGLEHAGHDSTLKIDLEYCDWNSVEQFEMPTEEDTVTQSALISSQNPEEASQ